MHRVALLVVVVCAVSCKKEQPAGMAPSTDWQGGQDPAATAPAPTPAPKPANPHADGTVPMTPTNPHDTGGGGGPMAAAKTAPQALEKQPDGRLVMGPFTFVAPKEWTEKPVTSSMRSAQFELSAKPGEEAELVVYYFGEGGAGGVDANLERWLGQVAQADGKPSKDVAKIEKTKIAGQEATTVAVAGHITTQQMPGGPPGIDMQDGAMIGAIVGSPKGPYYFKLTGRKKTVDANVARFKAMLASMKLKS